MKVHMEDVYKKFKAGLAKDEIILDVREDDEWEEAHIPGAKHLPVDMILEDPKKHAGELQTYSKVYIHCGGGGRAGRAATALMGAGLNSAVHVAGSGMRHWQEQGYPVKKGK